MKDTRKYLRKIVENIRQIDPHKIILFGSSVLFQKAGALFITK